MLQAWYTFENAQRACFEESMPSTVVNVELASYKHCLAITFCFVDNEVEMANYKLTKCDVIFDLDETDIKLKDFNRILGPTLAKTLGDDGIALSLSDAQFAKAMEGQTLLHYNVVEAPEDEDPFDSLIHIESVISQILASAGFKLLGIERNTYEKYDGSDLFPNMIMSSNDKTLN
jgi:hypothetical protein